MTDRTNRLGEENVGKLLTSFSLPAIVGMLAQGIYNLVDRIFVGHAVGQEGIAGTTADLLSAVLSAIWLALELRHLDARHGETALDLA